VRRCPLVIPVVALALAAPAPASGDVLSEFQKLAGLGLSRPPLVPTTAPTLLRPIDATIFASELSSGYSIRLVSGRRNNQVLLVQGGAYPSMRAARRAFRRARYRARPTRVRGARGFVVTRAPSRAVLWAEGGVVYFVATTTSRTVPFAEVRATAEGLDRLGGSFVGSDESTASDVQVAVTSRTVTVDVLFRGQCTLPDGSSLGLYRGHAYASLAPRQGDGFAVEIGPNVDAEGSELAWQGTVSGTVGADGASVDFRATGTGEEGSSCDTGPVSVQLRPRP
jgi:hypothetical protein